MTRLLPVPGQPAKVTAMQSSTRAIWAIFLVFFSESLVLGNWIPRIPDIKDQVGLTDFTLGVCLLAVPAGTICAFLVAGRMIEFTGLRNSCRIWLPLWALMFTLPGFISSVYWLFAVLCFAGFTIGLCEVAMNSKADMIEQQFAARIMSRCHGFWSLGSMAGALIGGALAQWQWTVAQHYLLVMPMIAVFAYLVCTALPDDIEPSPEDGDTLSNPAHAFRLPSASIAMLCLMPVGIMAIEGAYIDWSALFMREELNASPIIIAITYSFFSLVMAAVRLSGDALAERFGVARLIKISTISAAAGITLFSLAPNIAFAFAGAALSGLGVALVYPMAITAVARRPGNVTDNVASMSLFAFAAFLLAPPFIGFLSEIANLRWALLSLLPFALLSVYLAPEVTKPTP
jgi:MFS family permease